MKRYILYSTSGSKWFKEQADLFASGISKSKGRGDVIIADIIRKIPKDVPIEVDGDGDLKPTWEWFSRTFPQGDYDGVIFHLTPYYRRKWGISGNIGGSSHTSNKNYVEFWACADKGQIAKGYEAVGMSNFLRILFHEQAHFDENLDDELGNILTQDSVHDFDYRLKKIHQYHFLVDYRGKALKEKVNALTNAVIKLVKKFV